MPKGVYPKSAEHRAKLADAARKQQERLRLQGGPAPNKGVRFSDEARANMAKARIGNTNAKRHGLAESPTWYSWKTMHDRCKNSSNPYYGGRGIAVCQEWTTFEAFLADMGERPDGKTLDRIDNDRGYGPDNCRWATPKDQRANQRSHARSVSV